jgi:hypothetical protein
LVLPRCKSVVETKALSARFDEANADWKTGDQLYRYDYMLLKEDGLTAEEVGWL